MAFVNKEKLLEQKKVVFRILRDVIFYHRTTLSDEELNVLYWLGSTILNLSDAELSSAMKLNPFTFPFVVEEMSKIQQESFRRMLKELLTHDGRIASSNEIEAVESFLMAYPNPYGLENQFEKIPPLYPDYKWRNNLEYLQTQPFYVTCWI